MPTTLRFPNATRLTDGTELRDVLTAERYHVLGTARTDHGIDFAVVVEPVSGGLPQVIANKRVGRLRPV